MKNNIIFTIFLFLFSLSFYAQDTGFGDLSDSETDSADSGFGDLSSIEAPADDGSSSFGESGSQATEESARPLFWVYYPHAREILKKGRVFNERNSSVSKSFDDLINARRFSAVIYREENVRQNRDISSYITKNAFMRLLESERIKEKIRNFEHDMWSW